MFKSGLLLAAAAFSLVEARVNSWDPPVQKGFGVHKLVGATPYEATPKTGNSTFQQILEHGDPYSQKFSQWYMYSTEYWKGPGYPVILFTPGEGKIPSTVHVLYEANVLFANASAYTTYLTTSRSTGVLAEKIGAAIICLEHRFWGFSSPTDDLSAENLQPLTLYNSIQDLTNFANTANLPWATKDHPSNAKDVPWVLLGGSYSGALTAWTESTAPGTFWAYWASSAVVETISDFWTYFLPVQDYMPQNCSRDVSQVIDYMDGVIQSGNQQQISQLKKNFGLSNVTHNDDFMAVLENGPWYWQSQQLYTGYAQFSQFCDSIEGVYNNPGAPIPDGNGVGLDNAVNNYAKWTREIYLQNACAAYGYEGLTQNYSTWCFNTYDFNNPLFRDTSLSNQVDRQWNWMLCNEPFGWWQDGAPINEPTIVSRLANADYYIRQCGVYFPAGPNGETYGIANGKTENSVNEFTGGWSARNSSRLLYVSGDRDPWRDAQVFASTRPGGPLQSTPEVPLFNIPGGFHTSDLVTKNGQVNPECAAVQAEIVKQMVDWVNEWPAYASSTSSATSKPTSTTTAKATSTKSATTKSSSTSSKTAKATPRAIRFDA